MLDCRLLLIWRSISEAKNASLALANLLARCKSIRAPQYGQIFVFCPTAASSKPLHLLHSTINVMGIECASSERLFHTHPNNVMGERVFSE